MAVEKMTTVWGVLGLFNFCLAISNSWYTSARTKQPLRLPDEELLGADSSEKTLESRPSRRLAYILPAAAFFVTAALNIASICIRGNPFDMLARLLAPTTDVRGTSSRSIGSSALDAIRSIVVSLCYIGHHGDEWATLDSLSQCASDTTDGVFTRYQCESDAFAVFMIAIFALSGVLNFLTAIRVMRRGEADEALIFALHESEDDVQLYGDVGGMMAEKGQMASLQHGCYRHT